MSSGECCSQKNSLSEEMLYASSAATARCVGERERMTPRDTQSADCVGSGRRWGPVGRERQDRRGACAVCVRWRVCVRGRVERSRVRGNLLAWHGRVRVRVQRGELLGGTARRFAGGCMTRVTVCVYMRACLCSQPPRCTHAPSCLALQARWEEAAKRQREAHSTSPCPAQPPATRQRSAPSSVITAPRRPSAVTAHAHGQALHAPAFSVGTGLTSFPGSAVGSSGPAASIFRTSRLTMRRPSGWC